MSAEQALSIAQADALQYSDLSPYRIHLALESDGWHVDYELKDPRLKGGGPHYVIDALFGGASLEAVRAVIRGLARGRMQVRRRPMPRQKTTKPRVTAVKKKKESLKEIYARLKREFTAADLQKYTVIEPMVPAEQVLAKMKEMYRRHTLKKKASNGRKR